MATGVASWSQTAASNSTSDVNVNWAEGQAPSSVNDSARAMMASVAKWRDDISGSLTTGGTATAYTLTSNQGFGTLAAMNGMLVAFTPHAANGGTCTINIDALGAKPLRPAPSVEFAAGDLVAGTPYIATYYNSTGEVIVSGAGAMPTYVPLGAMMDYTGGSTPNSRFVFPTGQSISRTTYANYYALVGTTFGTGDGSTTFNVPDLRGRVVAGVDGGAGRLDSTGGMNGTGIGSTGGAQTRTIAQANLPAVTLTTTITDPGHTHGVKYNTGTATSGAGSVVSALSTGGITSSNTDTTTTGITASTALGGSGTAFILTQPTITLNKILRVL